MAPHLPLEILHIIAAHLQAAESLLTQCILVCRSWRAAFEPLVYSKLRISSAATSSIEDKGVLPLDEFEKLTSDAGKMRRSWIRHIDCKIVVPHLLKNYTTIVSGNFTIDNPVRQSNDSAFQKEISNLFNLLSSWSSNLHISLELSLHGEVLCGEEPLTCGAVDTRDFDYDGPGGQGVVPPYCATLPDGCRANISKAACIKRLSFPPFEEHQIGAGAALHIAHYCSEITELDLGMDGYIRPDHLEYIQSRRLAVAKGFTTAPGSLRVLHYYSQREEPWIECLPGLQLIPDSSIDLFSINLRNLSYQLRELYLELTSVDTDFLCPLNDNNMPSGNTSETTWPYLEKITLDQHPPVLPSGAWLIDLTPEGQAEFDAITDMDEAISTEENVPKRYAMDHEAFHRIFISLGYAARRMPRLREISFALNFHVHNYFTYLRNGVEATIKWRGGPYVPDERVARAWGFKAESLRVTGGETYKDADVEWL
ncbi:hypothetical protein BDV12DRAFT_164623 [Aspergillus spectabilis]